MRHACDSFLDSEVVAQDFKESLCKIVKVVKPFVHWYGCSVMDVSGACSRLSPPSLNDMMTIQDQDSSDDDEDGEEGGEGGDDDGEGEENGESSRLFS